MIESLAHITRLVMVIRVLGQHRALWWLDELSRHSRRIAWLLRAMRILRLIPPARDSQPPAGAEGWARPGARLAAALEALGPGYVKLGQALSLRADLIGAEPSHDLATLQDGMAPFPFAAVHGVIAGEFGKPPGVLFRSFEEKPVAAASLAQAHFATTHEGRDVAVKILRPQIGARLERDLRLFMWLARMVHKTVPRLRHMNLPTLVRAFRDGSGVETDLRLEGAAASELHQNCRDDAGFQVPEIHWELTGRRMLTMARVRGLSVRDVAGLQRAGHDPAGIAEICARTFLHQLLRDGYFHADAHPGNLFVDDAGRLIPVDFGIMGRADRRTRMFVADMLTGFLDRDAKRIATACFAMRLIPRNLTRAHFAAAIRGADADADADADAPPPGEGADSLAGLVRRIIRAGEGHAMPAPPAELPLALKALLILDGVGRQLDPSGGFWQQVRPLIDSWLVENRDPVPAPDTDPGDAADPAADEGTAIHPKHVEEKLARLSALHNRQAMADTRTTGARARQWGPIVILGILAGIMAIFHWS